MTSILWFRQDLRLADQAALAAAAAEGPVLPVYVLDDEGPGPWRIGAAQRWWLHHSLRCLGEALERKGSRLILLRGAAAATIAALAERFGITRVHALAHYEPWWQAEERKLGERVELCLHPGRLLAPPTAVRTGSGGRYRIFTPFWKALQQQMPPPPPQRTPRKIDRPNEWPASEDLGDWSLLPTRPNWAKGFDVWTPGEAAAKRRLRAFVDDVAAYQEGRNLPSEDLTSRLSPYLHMGEISPAAVWHAVVDEPGFAKGKTFLSELAWRDFASGLIDQFPDYGERPSRDAFNRFAFRSIEKGEGKAAWRAWCAGRTGYPIVDAGQRQLWATGWMHNRVRMISASFLVKHLLIDWREGERWFWDCLVDADYANNALGWQWVMGSGVDSSPFNRVFNPKTQSAKFAAADYIRAWVPELAGLSDRHIHVPSEAPAQELAEAGVRLGVTYPEPIIVHEAARERALETYRQAKG